MNPHAHAVKFYKELREEETPKTTEACKKKNCKLCEDITTDKI